MKPKTLTRIVASTILTIAPLLSGCYSKDVPVYGPADPNGNREVIGTYRINALSTGLTIDTYEPQKKKPEYDPNSI